MNVKIQGGGGGAYANTGSSFGAMQYLNHENSERIAENKQIEPFFDHQGESRDFGTMITELDQNKAKLSAKDAKFFALTISPSEKELSAMGSTEQERSHKMKGYVRDVMDEYAKNFNKGLRGEDLLYYAKVHHNRGIEKGMHAHIIVSRKSKNNKVRLSPKTNHRQQSGKINGFDRTNFFQKAEDRFDISFNHRRDFKETFDYQNTVKNGTVEEIKAIVKQAESTPIKPLLEERERVQILEAQEQNNQDKSQAKKINLEQIPKPTLTPEREQNRGFGRGM